MNADLERRILEIVEGPNYQPVKCRVIAKKLGLAEDEARELRRTVKRLVREGRLAWGAGHYVMLPNKVKTANRLVGVFRRTAAGNGFVRPAGTAAAAGRTKDIFIPRNRTLDAASGDTVMIRLRSKRDRDGGPTGEIVEIVERDTHRFVGVYQIREGVACVGIDGGIFAEPILIGDPSAHRAHEGDKVVVELVRFPSHISPGEGVVVEVLGPRGEPGVDTLSIIREFNLPDEFPADVLAEARAQAERFEEERGDRRDLTAETILTIDPIDARDFDDAISLRRLENGHWLLGVHIADVSHFVPQGSALDLEARQRGTSVYLPDRVIPMLPEIISNNLASLQPERVRYAKTCRMEFTEEGVFIDSEVFSSAIRSSRRFTYEEVDEYLADPPGWREKLTPAVWELLARMHELAMILRERRMRGGSLELVLPEVKVALDDQGRVSGAYLVENTVSHQIIEEFMLAANIAVAEKLASLEIPFLRRIHGTPDPRKLQALTEFVGDLGIEADNLQSRFEIQRVIDAARGRPEQQAINYAVLRSMQKAVYGPEEEGHYALAFDCYCHFTSPIRRYPDLTIHRLFTALEEGRRPVSDFAQLELLGQQCSDREQRAEKAERELKKVKLLTYFAERIGHEMAAVVTGVESFGIFAQGVEIPAEGMIHIEALPPDYYDYDERGHTLTGRRSGRVLRLGDVIQVAVAHVDVDRRKLDFRLVEGEGAPARGSAAKRPAPRGAGKEAKGRSLRRDAPPPKGKRRRGRPRG